MDNATIKKDSIASTLLTNQTLNLFGIGSALIGLQARYLMHTLARSLWMHHTCWPSCRAHLMLLIAQMSYARCDERRLRTDVTASQLLQAHFLHEAAVCAGNSGGACGKDTDKLHIQPICSSRAGRPHDHPNCPRRLLSPGEACCHGSITHQGCYLDLGRPACHPGLR